jgi:hypothetical protein
MNQALGSSEKDLPDYGVIGVSALRQPALQNSSDPAPAETASSLPGNDIELTLLFIAAYSSRILIYLRAVFA